MTYASQQLADALQTLVREADAPRPAGYSSQQIPVAFTPESFSFSRPVAEFLEKTGRYAAQTKTISVGTY